METLTVNIVFCPSENETTAEAAVREAFTAELITLIDSWSPIIDALIDIEGVDEYEYDYTETDIAPPTPPDRYISVRVISPPSVATYACDAELASQLVTGDYVSVPRAFAVGTFAHLTTRGIVQEFDVGRPASYPSPRIVGRA